MVLLVMGWVDEVDVTVNVKVGLFVVGAACVVDEVVVAAAAVVAVGVIVIVVVMTMGVVVVVVVEVVVVVAVVVVVVVVVTVVGGGGGAGGGVVVSLGGGGLSLYSGHVALITPILFPVKSKTMSLCNIQDAPNTVSAPGPSSSNARHQSLPLFL